MAVSRCNVALERTRRPSRELACAGTNCSAHIGDCVRGVATNGDIGVGSNDCDAEDGSEDAEEHSGHETLSNSEQHRVEHKSWGQGREGGGGLRARDFERGRRSELDGGSAN